MRSTVETVRKMGLSMKAAMIGAVCMLSATAAHATYDPNHQFITNGGFETSTSGVGQLAYNTTAVGWTSATDGSGNRGYNFLMSGATASTTGANGVSGNLQLWGPGNGSANGLTSSPTGGNFIAADGAYQTGAISQAITGLIVGQTYTLSFDFAGAQQKNFDGATTEAWNFGLANEGGVNANTTQVLNNASHGFTGWYNQTYSFVASQTSDTLYFLAVGTPNGVPPFSLLDSVSLTGGFGSAAPDPATWMTLLVGFGIVGASLRLRRRSPKAVAALA